MKHYNEEIEEELEMIKKGIILEIVKKLNHEELTTLDIKILAEAYKELT